MDNAMIRRLLLTLLVGVSLAVSAQLAAGAPLLRLERILGDQRGKIRDSVSVTATGDGGLFVLARDGHISEFDAEGGYRRTLRVELSYPPEPYSLQARDGRVFLCHRERDFPQLTEPWRRGEQPGRFQGPRDALLDAEGRLYVADTGNRRVQIFAPGGEQPAEVLPLEHRPLALDVRGERLALLTDQPGLRLYERAEGRWELRAEAAAPRAATDVALGPDPADLYVLCTGGWAEHRLERWRHEGGRLQAARTLADSFMHDWPDMYGGVPLTAGPDGAVWWADSTVGALLRWAPGEERASEVIQGLREPVSVAFLGADTLLLGARTARAPAAVYRLPLASPQGDQAEVFLPWDRLSEEGPQPVWGLLPDAGGGVFSRYIEAGWRKGWPAITLRRLHPEEDSRPWLDFGPMFAVRRPFPPWEARLGLAWLPDGNLAFTALPMVAVYKVTPEGEILWEASREPRGGADRVGLEGPADLGLDRQGRIWVADADLPAILCFSPEGRLLLRHGEPGEMDRRDGVGLGVPQGIAVVPAGEQDLLVVGDARFGHLLVYSIHEAEQ